MVPARGGVAARQDVRHEVPVRRQRALGLAGAPRHVVLAVVGRQQMRKVGQLRHLKRRLAALLAVCGRRRGRGRRAAARHAHRARIVFRLRRMGREQHRKDAEDGLRLACPWRPLDESDAAAAEAGADGEELAEVEDEEGYFASEFLACTFNDNKGPSDMRAAVVEFNSYLDGIESGPYFYGVYYPEFEDSQADVLWGNWHSDFETKEAGNATYAEYAANAVYAA